MKNLFPFFALLLAMLASSFSLSTSAEIRPLASVDYYLTLDGIPGESRDADHKGWIELESIALNRAAKTVSIVRPVSSKASPLLQLACSSGQHIKKAVLHVRKAGGDGSYMKYELENVLITNYQISGSGDRPMESLSLNYTKIVF